MSTISSRFRKNFVPCQYKMNTGSDEWQMIKSDFEIEDDAIGGTLSFLDNNHSLDLDKIKEFKNSLEIFKTRVDDYVPKDEVESKEKEILLNEIKDGLVIYGEILKN